MEEQIQTSKLTDKLMGLILPLKIIVWFVVVWWLLKVGITIVNLVLSLLKGG